MKREYEKGYKMPLKQDNYGMYIWDANKEMAAQFLDYESIKLEKSILIDHINGYVNITSLNKPFTIEYGIIRDCNNQEIIMLRGWGNLTGVGGLNLSDDEAAKIQDDFGNFLVERLNAGIGELK